MLVCVHCVTPTCSAVAVGSYLKRLNTFRPNQTILEVDVSKRVRSDDACSRECGADCCD